MKLAITIVFYCMAIAIALGVLYGPLRRAVDPKQEHGARVIVPLIAVAIIFIIVSKEYPRFCKRLG